MIGSSLSRSGPLRACERTWLQAPLAPGPKRGNPSTWPFWPGACVRTDTAPPWTVRGRGGRDPARPDELEATLRGNHPSACTARPTCSRRCAGITLPADATLFHIRGNRLRFWAPLPSRGATDGPPGDRLRHYCQSPDVQRSSPRRAAALDFRLIGGSIENLDDGVVLSIGSAIMAPRCSRKASAVSITSASRPDASPSKATPSMWSTCRTAATGLDPRRTGERQSGLLSPIL